MKRMLFVVALAMTTSSAFADTSVRGYYRRDGTYVQPHIRSAPNSQRYDNYGSAPRSGSGYGYQSPYSRDQDNDGLSNQFDMDDNNDGTFDDSE